ncbi:hypothetical protein MN116_006519 [Schistosoma mekongi]|uniref:Gamma-glutamyltransferase 7 n=1 Tax=Schistosoma mekongi TaxID=38744 RepID=A0AAE1ZA79_SCHME|nr:hypothetical protein MN116_006519 [Schistosoma mekongi]
MESKSKEKNQDIELTQSDISKTHQVPFREDNEYIVSKDTESILKDSTSESNKKWKLEGVNIVVLSVIILSTSVTIALILTIIFGEPQIIPHGAVAVDDDFCGQIGINIMQKNKGNAVDAMVSVMLCLTVTRPDVASLGGCGAVLIRDRNKQLSYLYDFSCPVRNSAGQDKPDRKKPASLVGIPSLVRGLSAIHRRFGLLKWSDLFIGAIDLAKNGFMPRKSLIEAVNKINASNLSESLKSTLQQLTNEDNPYFPPVELRDTLKRLAEQRDYYFYNDDINTFNRQFVDYMKQQGFQWSLDDLKNYTVHRPNPLKMNFAGFTLESFPAPLVGGVYILLLLGNLDLKDAISPLDHQALLRQDPSVTAVYLHRLLELSRLAEASVTTLGDLDDPTIRVAATIAQDSILSQSMREASVTSILDNDVVKEHSQLDVLQSTYEGSSIGGTGIVTTDSTSFTVVGNIFMGSPFGNGQIIPGTGVHLNSALQLFSETKLNKFAAGRRPLVPIGPVYLSTTRRKCGIRVGVASTDGLWGLTDAAQVISNAVLFLRGAQCQTPTTFHTYGTMETISSSINGKEQSLSMPYISRSIFSPSTEKHCINQDYAINLTRLHPIYNISMPGSVTIESSPWIQLNFLNKLKQLNYNIQLLSTNKWPSRVFLAGWNGYDMISAGDYRSLNSKTLYTF